MESILPGFIYLPPVQQTATLFCPTLVVTAKLANKYIQTIFKVRKLLDEGVPALNIDYDSGTIIPNECCDNSDNAGDYILLNENSRFSDKP